MSIFNILRILDLETLFRQSPDPVVLTSLDFTQPGYAETLSKLLYMKGSDISFAASCECDHLRGNFFIGMTCPVCRSVIMDPLVSVRGQIPIQAWIEIPQQIKGVLNPIVYLIISEMLPYARVGSCLDFYFDPNTTPPPEFRSEVSGIPEGCGFNHLYDHFDQIIDYLISINKRPKVAVAKHNGEILKAFLQKYRDRIFTRHLPVMNSALHTMTMTESSQDRQYADKTSQYVLESVHTLATLNFYPNKARNMQMVEKAMLSAFRSHMTYMMDIIETRLRKKNSIVRKHIMGHRLHFSFRGVIRQIPGPHDCDCIHVPWSLAVNLFRPDIIGHLIRKDGCTLKEAIAAQQQALCTTDTHIRKIMETAIEKAPFKGLPVWINRNPSLRRGSTMLMYILKIHDDPKDHSIGFPSLSVAAPNADQRITHRRNHQNRTKVMCLILRNVMTVSYQGPPSE